MLTNLHKLSLHKVISLTQQVSNHLILFLDAKHGGSGENVNVSMEDENGETNEKAAQADGMKKGENEKESEALKKGGKVSMPKLIVGSKKRKSSVEMSWS